MTCKDIMQNGPEDFEDALKELIKGLNFQHLNLKEDVADREQDLKDTEKELADFVEDNKEYLV